MSEVFWRVLCAPLCACVIGFPALFVLDAFGLLHNDASGSLIGIGVGIVGLVVGGYVVDRSPV